jgi:hypothetical protein
MRAKVAMQALAHAAVTVDNATQWASHFIAHSTAKAAASGEIFSISHVRSIEAHNAADKRSFGVGSEAQRKPVALVGIVMCRDSISLPQLFSWTYHIATPPRYDNQYQLNPKEKS